jgi:fatty-acyl-CoA synthase
MFIALLEQPRFGEFDLTSLRTGIMAGAPCPPALRRVVIYDPASPAETQRPQPGFTTWAEVLAAGNGTETPALDAATAALDPDEAINIQYTSGTTGFPKAVVLSHHNILNNAWFSARAMHFGAHDRLCVPVPFYHCFGMVLANLLCLSVGACIVIPCEHFEPLAVLQAIGSERCTMACRPCSSPCWNSRASASSISRACAPASWPVPPARRR